MVPPLDWLLECDEPWTRYRTLVDLLGLSESDRNVVQAREEMIRHPMVQRLVTAVAAWPGAPIRRHNDSGHPIQQLAVLADMGFRRDDQGVGDAERTITARTCAEGLPLSLVNIPVTFGGTGLDSWSWMLCDAPSLLCSLARLSIASGVWAARRDAPIRTSDAEGQFVSYGLRDCDEQSLLRATRFLASLIHDNGWHCTVDPALGKFRGPGKRSDPCPMANLLALKALAPFSELRTTAAARAGAEVLLSHWEASERARERLPSAPGEVGPRQEKPYLFGCGSEYRKLRYPMVWYDCLNALQALRPYPFVHSDGRFLSLKAHVQSMSDKDGRFTANAMYRPWSGWSFADKKRPSPWLTLLVWRELQPVTAEGG